MINNSLPVEEVDTEVVPFTAIGNHGELIKDDNDELTSKQLDFILSELSKDFKDKYEDRVVFIEDIPVEKQKEFIECFKTNDKDTINTTLEIIMNDYSKDKSEIFAENKSTIIYDHSELDEVVTYPFYKRPDLPVTFCNMIGRKCGNFTTKHQPNKKSKKAARRNNRRAKRNNR